MGNVLIRARTPLQNVGGQEAHKTSTSKFRFMVHYIPTAGARLASTGAPPPEHFFDCLEICYSYRMPKEQSNNQRPCALVYVEWDPTPNVHVAEEALDQLRCELRHSALALVDAGRPSRGENEPESSRGRRLPNCFNVK